jgi:adenine-specific DNA-methyltransferase
MFLSEARGLTPTNFWPHDYAGNTDDGTKDLEDLIPGKVFNNPKPVVLLRRIIEHACDTSSLILDLFSGSGVAAHATMQLNAEDGGNRKFIMVQLPEPCDEKSEAFKAGYKTIAEIGKERIRRAGKKIKEENATTAPNLDIGFRVFKVDTSNMKDMCITRRTN